jgi:DNA processing protein
VNIRFIPRNELPEREKLTNAEPPVLGLWHVGLPLNELRPRVAIVGARDATPYGYDVARTLAADLALRGFVIVSGMARGIDTEAHRGALSVPTGRTIAVLAGPVDKPYPRSSKTIYEEIRTRGAIVSENEVGSVAWKHEFVKRNRIIAAMSDAVIIVQADKDRSGAMKTADAAMGLGIHLFGVPGDVRSNLSTGPHELLRLGNHICANVNDVLEVLGYAKATDEEKKIYIPPHLPSDEKRMLVAVGKGPATADDLIARTKLESSRASRALASLELAGFIRRDPTGCYVYV